MEQLNSTNKHKTSVFNQKFAFDEEKKSVSTTKCLIIIDFKKNNRIGRRPIKFKKYFYNYNQLSVLGFSVINKDENSKKVIKYYDFISEIFFYDSLFASECFLELFKLLKMKNFFDVSIWTDGGPHFKFFELLHFIFKQLSQKIKGELSHNYFTRYHSKSIFNGHFGLLPRLLKEIESYKKIKNLKEVLK